MPQWPGKRERHVPALVWLPPFISYGLLAQEKVLLPVRVPHQLIFLELSLSTGPWVCFTNLGDYLSSGKWTVIINYYIDQEVWAEETLCSPLSSECNSHHRRQSATTCEIGKWKKLRFRLRDLLCDKNFFWGDATHIHLPQLVNLQQTQVHIPLNSDLVNKWVLLRLLKGTEMIQNTCITKAHPNPGLLLHKAGNMEYSAQPTGSSTSSFLGLNLFQIAWLDSASISLERLFCSFSPCENLPGSSVCLTLSNLASLDLRGILCFYWLLWQGRISFRDFLKLLELFAFLLKEHSYRMECFNVGGNC